MLNEVPNAVKDAKQAVKDSKEVLQNPPKIVDGNWYIYDYAKILIKIVVLMPLVMHLLL